MGVNLVHTVQSMSRLGFIGWLGKIAPFLCSVSVRIFNNIPSLLISAKYFLIPLHLLTGNLFEARGNVLVLTSLNLHVIC